MAFFIGAILAPFGGLLGLVLTGLIESINRGRAPEFALACIGLITALLILLAYWRPYAFLFCQFIFVFAAIAFVPLAIASILAAPATVVAIPTMHALLSTRRIEKPLLYYIPLGFVAGVLSVIVAFFAGSWLITGHRPPIWIPVRYPPLELVGGFAGAVCALIYQRVMSRLMAAPEGEFPSTGVAIRM